MTEFNRREFFGLLGAAGAAYGAGRGQPNILYIMADDHAAHAISAYGSRINRTPNIDRIAAGGMRFDNCFCTNSICTPSRAAILTGQYSHRNGVYTLADRFDGSRNHVAKQLQSAGYQTAHDRQVAPRERSDRLRLLEHPARPGRLLRPGVHRRRREEEAPGLLHGPDHRLHAWTGSRSATRSKPFFLMCHHKAPHRPWEPGAEARARCSTARPSPSPTTCYDDYEGTRAQRGRRCRCGSATTCTKADLKVDRPAGLEGDALRKWAYQHYIKDYLRCVQSVDDNVGRLLDYLDAEGLAANTIVIYTSDQGFFLGDHGWFDKRFMYEESLRMPFLVRYPGAIKPGTVNDDMVLNIDFAPTFLDYAGAKAPAEMQGRSFRANLEGRTPKDWRTSMYYRYWMHNDSDHHVPAHYGVRTERYKLIYYYGKPLGMNGAIEPATEPEWELFDMRKDPREMHNVYSDPAYKNVVDRMKTELQRLQQEAGDTPA